MSSPDLNVLNAEILKEFPAYRVIYKADSVWMKILNGLLLFVTLGQMRTYMTSFITSIGNTVYVPSEWMMYNTAAKCVILRHERVHMRQARRMGRILFSLCYMLWPLPMGLSWGRASLEMEAYTETLTAWHEYGADITKAVEKEAFVGFFTSSAYGWMFPFPKRVAAWYDRTVAEILKR